MLKKLWATLLSVSTLVSSIGWPVLANEQECEESLETSSSVPMYRLYNPNSGEHFYTSNSRERDSLVQSGWYTEGIGWVAPAYSNTPVYRLYNKKVGDHHYTTDSKERDSLVRLGWQDEGIRWYSDDSKTIPVYRQYNPQARAAGSHNYTTNKEEIDILCSIGWKYEGIGWYAIQKGELISSDPEPTPTTPSTFPKEVLEQAAGDYYQGGFNADVHFGLRLYNDGTFLGEEQFFIPEAPMGGYRICRYTGSFKEITQVSEHVYSAIVSDIQSSNTPFYKEYQGTGLKIEYNFNPQFFANGYKVYIFDPNATSAEIKAYAPIRNLSGGFEETLYNHWLIYTQDAKEILGKK